MLRDAVALIGAVIGALLGIVVCYVLVAFLVKSMRESARAGTMRSGKFDVRHFAITFVVAGAVASGLIAAGASTLVCALGALAGAVLGVLIATGIPEWEGSSVGRWVVGAVWCAMGIAAIGIGFAVRLTG